MKRLHVHIPVDKLDEGMMFHSGIRRFKQDFVANRSLLHSPIRNKSEG